MTHAYTLSQRLSRTPCKTCGKPIPAFWLIRYLMKLEVEECPRHKPKKD